MTVADLRARLCNLPDELPVILSFGIMGTNVKWAKHQPANHEEDACFLIKADEDEDADP